MRTWCFVFFGAFGLLTISAGVAFTQTDTNEGGYDEDELRELEGRIRALEAKEAERIERELASLRAQLREARRLDQVRVAPVIGAIQHGDSPQKTQSMWAGQSWRYRYHQGRWWYWRPSNSWAVYEQNRWVPYQSLSSARRDHRNP